MKEEPPHVRIARDLGWTELEHVSQHDETYGSVTHEFWCGAPPGQIGIGRRRVAVPRLDRMSDDLIEAMGYGHRAHLEPLASLRWLKSFFWLWW